jgi:hypothetical protein
MAINIIPFLLERGGRAAMEEIYAVNKEYSRGGIHRSIKKLESIGFIATDRKTRSDKADNIWLTDKESSCTPIDWLGHSRKRKV